MKLKELVAELQRSCEDGYGDYEVVYDTTVTSIATGFQYKLKSKIGPIYYCKNESKVGMCSTHFLELDDEQNRIYENMVHTEREVQRCMAEIDELQKEAEIVENNIKDMKSKQKSWWKIW